MPYASGKIKNTSVRRLVTWIVFIGVAVPGMATTFFNGSFEDPGVVGTSYLNQNLTPIAGWVHTGPGSFQHGEFYTDGVAWDIVPQQGNGYIGWGASGATGGTLSQTFDTVIGVTYVVNYYLTTQELLSPPFPQQIAFVQVFDAGSVELAHVSNSFAQAPGWAAGTTLTFTATSTSTTLRFTDQSIGGSGPGQGSFDINWALDNVTVAVATPEPETYAMSGLGLGIIAICRKKARAR